MNFSSAEECKQKLRKAIWKKFRLGFLYQVRVGQGHLLGPLQTFQLSKGKHPPEPSSTKDSQFNPGTRTEKACKKKWNKNPNITHPLGSIPQALIIHQILWGQETQAKLTKSEQGTDLGKSTSRVHVEIPEKGWGSEGQQRWEMNVLPGLHPGWETTKVHPSQVRYAWLWLQGLKPCVRLKGFFFHLCTCPPLIATH